MKNKVPLRTIVEYEGNSKPLDELARKGATGLQLLLVLLVRTFYIPARQLLGGDAVAAAQGRALMRVFADACGVLATLTADESVALALLAQQGQATAYGLLGSLATQQTINADVLRQVERNPDWGFHPDLCYVHTLAFFGLVENDEAYRQGISLFEWYTMVCQLGEEKAPDFAGRAARLVREVRARGFPDGFSREACVKLLRRAVRHRPSKEGQRSDARALLKELEATGP